MKGIDYSSGMPDIQAMKNASIEFVCRYVGYSSPSLPQTKILTPTESYTLSQNGFYIVSNFEWYNTRPREGYNAGVQDAHIAEGIHRSCGGPSSAPVYFSVDYNTDGSDTYAYFNGVISVLGLSRVGAYGGYACIKNLLDKKLITYAWQTYAWSSGQWDIRANIRQTENGVQLGGVEVDLDTSMTNRFGQWRIGEMFSNELCIAIWESYFKSISVAPPPRDTGIFNSWRQLWINGNFKGCCLSYEYPVTLPNGHPGVAQNYAGGTCTWDNTTSIPTWL
jgi:hypothetical protein